ncbi:MAG: hypothetical protein GY858_05980 [Candidatus Omnitrophica bacterium]|nr:hypothetical protein [Candidatus Omnitrophota bacterium]
MDVSVIMPNHMHGIIAISDIGKESGKQKGLGRVPAGSLAAIIRAFKSSVTKRVNESHDLSGAPIWQRNYYEHIIRNDQELDKIRKYIIDNPINWINDDENNKKGTARCAPTRLQLYKD